MRLERLFDPDPGVDDQRRFLPVHRTLSCLSRTSKPKLDVPACKYGSAVVVGGRQPFVVILGSSTKMAGSRPLSRTSGLTSSSRSLWYSIFSFCLPLFLSAIPKAGPLHFFHIPFQNRGSLSVYPQPRGVFTWPFSRHIFVSDESQSNRSSWR